MINFLISAKQRQEMWRILALSSLAVLVFLSIDAVAQNTAAADMALLTRAQGTINIEGQNKRPAATYIKLREGERVVMDSGSELQLVYFGSNQLETWRGRNVFVVGKEFSKAIEGNPASNRALPPGVANQLSKYAERRDSTDQANRVGMVRLRNFIDLERKKTIETYNNLRSNDNGNMPDVFLTNRLFELRLDKEVIEHLEKVTKEKPDNVEMKELLEYYRQLISATASAPAEAKPAK